MYDDNSSRFRKRDLRHGFYSLYEIAQQCVSVMQQRGMLETLRQPLKCISQCVNIFQYTKHNM